MSNEARSKKATQRGRTVGSSDNQARAALMSVFDYTTKLSKNQYLGDVTQPQTWRPVRRFSVGKRVFKSDPGNEYRLHVNPNVLHVGVALIMRSNSEVLFSKAIPFWQISNIVWSGGGQ